MCECVCVDSNGDGCINFIDYVNILSEYCGPDDRCRDCVPVASCTSDDYCDPEDYCTLDDYYCTAGDYCA